jgi:hypothetical protein
VFQNLPKSIAGGLDLALTARMKKPRKQSGQPSQWSVYKVSGSCKLAWPSSVEARNEEEARKKAYSQLDIRPAERFLIRVSRE